MDRVDASHWVALIAATEVHLAARLLPMRGVEVLAVDDRVWLRGPLSSHLPSDHLTGHVPSAEMPTGIWPQLSLSR